MTQGPKPLNRFEAWVSEHAVPTFVVVATLISIGAGAFIWTYQRQSATQGQVNTLRPQVTKINRAICNKRSLTDPAQAERCAERIRVGLINCRHSQPCRAAFLAVATSPPPARPISTPLEGGGAIQQPSNHGHQHPGPGSQPGQSNGHTPGQERPPAGQGGGQGDSSSGAGVEVCVEAVTCVEAEIGLPNLKGTL